MRLIYVYRFLQFSRLENICYLYRLKTNAWLFWQALEVTCLFQLYSAVWCFQSNGDVFAFQDQMPFRRLGVTKNLTPDPVVQATVKSESKLYISSKSRVKTTRILMFGLRYFVGAIRILTAHLLLTASGPLKWLTTS